MELAKHGNTTAETVVYYTCNHSFKHFFIFVLSFEKVNVIDLYLNVIKTISFLLKGH